MSESPQVTAIEIDTFDLRNGIVPVSIAGNVAYDTADSADSLMIEIGDDIDVSKSSVADARSKFRAWTKGEGTLEDRLAMIRYRNWSSPLCVLDDEAGFIRKLMAMPESPERTQAIRAAFVTPKTFRRCWREYAKWADPKLVARAESAYRESLANPAP